MKKVIKIANISDWLCQYVSKTLHTLFNLWLTISRRIYLPSEHVRIEVQGLNPSNLLFVSKLHNTKTDLLM